MLLVNAPWREFWGGVKGFAVRVSNNGGMDQQAQAHFECIENLQECRTECFSYFPITNTHEQENESKRCLIKKWWRAEVKQI